MSAPAMPVPVFAAVGDGGWGPVQDLRARPELRLVPSPRHAAVLLIAGQIAKGHLEALDRVHDQMPHPRGVVVWSRPAPRFSGGSRIDFGYDDVVARIVETFLALQRDPTSTAPDRLPDEEAHEWRGVGPHGQGGEGMMGGTPYGRPMAMTGDDRDGLILDQLQLRLGPFLAWLPPGLTLDVTMQGDVLQAVAASIIGGTTDDLTPPVPTDIGLPEVAELRWLSLGLHVHGLEGLSARAARLVGGSDRDAVRGLCRRVRRSGLLGSLRGVGRMPGHRDAAARWEGRLGALERDELASGDPAGGAEVGWTELGEWLRGMTLTDAVATVVSVQGRILAADRVGSAS